MSGWETTTIILVFLFCGCALVGWVMFFRALRNWKTMKEAHQAWEESAEEVKKDDDE